MDSDKAETFTLQQNIVSHGLWVTADPADALIDVEAIDPPTETMPYIGGMPFAHGTVVRITVSKEGYVTQTREVTMDADKTEDFTLEQEPQHPTVLVPLTVDTSTYNDVAVRVNGEWLPYSAGMQVEYGSFVEVFVSSYGRKSEYRGLYVDSMQMSVPVSLDSGTRYRLTIGVTPPSAVLALKLDGIDTPYSPDMEVAENAIVEATLTKTA